MKYENQFIFVALVGLIQPAGAVIIVEIKRNRAGFHRVTNLKRIRSSRPYFGFEVPLAEQPRTYALSCRDWVVLL